MFELSAARIFRIEVCDWHAVSAPGLTSGGMHCLALTDYCNSNNYCDGMRIMHFKSLTPQSVTPPQPPAPPPHPHLSSIFISLSTIVLTLIFRPLPSSIAFYFLLLLTAAAAAAV